jgi:hypothetical protein
MVVSLALASAGCTADRQLPDSIAFPGVPVVRNSSRNSALTSFSLATDPLIQTGARDDSDLEQELWNIVDAALTRSKLLIVSMNAGREVRAFDSTSAFVRTIGRLGEGPGEFSYVSKIVLPQRDSIFLLDNRRGRMNTYTMSGGSTGSTTMSDGGRYRGEMLCCFDDGAYLIREPLAKPGRRMWYGKRRQLALLVAEAGQNAAGATQVLELEEHDPGVLVRDYPVIYESGPPSNQTQRVHVAAPFGRRAFVLPVGDRILYGMPDAFEFVLFERSGKPIRVVRADFEPVPVTEAATAHVTSAWRKQLQNAAAGAAVSRAFDRIAEFPPSLPAYSQLLAEEDGTVWARLAEDPVTVTDQRWARFDTAGVLNGTLTIPPRYSVLRFSNGHAIVLHRSDENGFTVISAFEVIGTRERPT